MMQIFYGWWKLWECFFFLLYCARFCVLTHFKLRFILNFLRQIFVAIKTFNVKNFYWIKNMNRIINFKNNKFNNKQKSYLSNFYTKCLPFKQCFANWTKICKKKNLEKQKSHLGHWKKFGQKLTSFSKK